MAGQSYSDMTVSELGEELEQRGLPKSGKKAELIERLEQSDASGAQAPGETPDAEATDAAAPEASDAAGAEAEDDGTDDSEAGGGETESVPAEIESVSAEAETQADEGESPEADAEVPTEAAGEDVDADDPGSSAASTRRRGSAETTAARDAADTEGQGGTSGHIVSEPPRDAQGLIAVRAKARFVRTAPRKARLVMDHIRGKQVAEARAILRHTPRAAAQDISKLLESAVANAENNFELDPGDLKIGRAFVDEGPTIKRFRPRALGRATPIHKRTSHMTIQLTTTTADEPAATSAAGGEK